MAFKHLVVKNCSFLFGNDFSSQVLRSFSLSSLRCLKQIVEKREGKKLVIEGALLSDPNDSRLLKTATKHECCSVCSTNLDIKHTDVLILAQFVRSDGGLLPRRITGLCRLQQRRITKMVAMAQKAGLMSAITPETSKKDPKKRKMWKKFNTYFDENTIRPPRDYPKRSFETQHFAN